MDLRYLDFDFSEDTEGIGTFEAMASVAPAQLAELNAEIAGVLAWAFDRAPQAHGPLSEGFEWDHELQSQQDWSVGETITLSLSGRADFCLAFRERFELG